MSHKDVIANNLPVLREISGKLSQKELADKVSVSRRTIARLESRNVADPGVEQLARIAEVLGVPVSVLIEQKIVAMTLPIPAQYSAKLEGKERAKFIKKIIDALST